MKRVTVVLSLMLLVFAVSVQTQNQAPTPPPEIKALEVFDGDWTYEGEDKESPLGPAGKYSGKLTIRWIQNGFFQEWKSIEKSNLGDIERIEFDWYDPSTKSYPYIGFLNNGDSFSGVGKMDGNNWNWSNTTIHKGISYKVKGAITFTADGMIWTEKTEISSDGKTWKPLSDTIFTKVKNIK